MTTSYRILIALEATPDSSPRDFHCTQDTTQPLYRGLGHQGSVLSLLLTPSVAILLLPHFPPAMRVSLFLEHPKRPPSSWPSPCYSLTLDMIPPDTGVCVHSPLTETRATSTFKKPAKTLEKYTAHIRSAYPRMPVNWEAAVQGLRWSITPDKGLPGCSIKN